MIKPLCVGALFGVALGVVMDHVGFYQSIYDRGYHDTQRQALDIADEYAEMPPGVRLFGIDRTGTRNPWGHFDDASGCQNAINEIHHNKVMRMDGPPPKADAPPRSDDIVDGVCY